MLAPPPPPGPVAESGFSTGPVQFGRPQIIPVPFSPYPPYSPYAYEGYAWYHPFSLLTNWISILVFFFFIIIILAAFSGASGASGASSSFTSGMTFPTSSCVTITNTTGVTLTNVSFFTNNQQSMTVYNAGINTIFPHLSSFTVPLQSGSMIYAADSSNSIYGMVVSNINGILQLAPFSNVVNVTSPFSCSAGITANPTSSARANIPSLLSNPITPPSSIPLASGATYPSSVTVTNESSTNVTVSLLKSISIGTVASQVSVTSGSSSLVSTTVPVGGYCFILATSSNTIESGTILFNQQGKVTFQTLFGESLNPTVNLFVPTGYTLPSLQ